MEIALAVIVFCALVYVIFHNPKPKKNGVTVIIYNHYPNDKEEE